MEQFDKFTEVLSNLKQHCKKSLWKKLLIAAEKYKKSWLYKDFYSQSIIEMEALLEILDLKEQCEDGSFPILFEHQKDAIKKYDQLINHQKEDEENHLINAFLLCLQNVNERLYNDCKEFTQLNMVWERKLIVDIILGIIDHCEGIKEERNGPVKKYQ